MCKRTIERQTIIEANCARASLFSSPTQQKSHILFSVSNENKTGNSMQLLFCVQHLPPKSAAALRTLIFKVREAMDRV